MSDIQEFRDRCARAMGWKEKKNHYGPWTAEGFPVIERFADYYVKGDELAFAVESWRPDEDYNQAMMMRDQAIGEWTVAKVTAFCEALLTTYAHDWKRQDMELSYLLKIAFSRCSARQIAEAALMVLEEQ